MMGLGSDFAAASLNSITCAHTAEATEEAREVGSLQPADLTNSSSDLKPGKQENLNRLKTQKFLSFILHPSSFIL